jgi:nucleoside-diphosphate-sugar epimerase
LKEGMISKIAFIGITGMLGRPVAKELANAGFEVTGLVRHPSKIKTAIGAHVTGDIRNPSDVNNLFAGKDAVYVNLSVHPGERSHDWHSETDGMKIIIDAAKKCSLKRILLISSLVQRYQGMNNFNWWVFDVKERSIELVKQSGIPFTIFYPSTFMETLTGKFKQGNKLLLAGKSEYPMYYIAAEDYGKQVARSLQMERGSTEYVVQGLEAFTQEKAAEVFVKNFKKERLSVMRTPIGLLKVVANFSREISYGVHILEAMNRYPEKFESQNTWDELGKPTITLAQFAASC